MRKFTACLPRIGILIALVGMTACGGASTQEENRQIVSRYIEEFKNQGNHDIVDELVAPDFVHHFTDPRLPPGPDALKLLGQAIVAGFPDVQATVNDLIASGDKVIERTTASATHNGEFNGVPATGNRVTWTEIHIYRLSDGKIVELWSEIDLLALLAQIGALPPA